LVTASRNLQNVLIVFFSRFRCFALLWVDIAVFIWLTAEYTTEQ